MNATDRLSLPFILPGQAQKEIFHNESLQTLDILVAGAVEEPPRSSPPTLPAVGACYIVAENPTGDWVDHANHIAAYTSAGLRFVAPVEGMAVYVRSTSETAAYRNGTWELGIVRGSTLIVANQQVVGTRGDAIDDPVGGSTIDAEARSAIITILTALRQHGLIAS